MTQTIDCVAGDSGYDEARRIRNDAIGRYPAVMARCTLTGDVSAAIGVHARTGGWTSRSGRWRGCSGATASDGGLMIDLDR